MRRLVFGACIAVAAASTASARAADLHQDRAIGPSIRARAHGAYDRAVTLAERAARAHPHDAWARYQLGMALAMDGATDDAVAVLDRAEAMFAPKEWRGRSVAVYGQARAYDMAGRCKEAAIAYRRYAQMIALRDPDAAARAIDYAVACHERTGEPLPATFAGERELAPLHVVDPSSEKLRAASRITTAAIDELTAGRYVQAETLASRAAAANPDDPWPAYVLGAALDGQGAVDGAVKAYDRALSLFDVDDVWGEAQALYGRARALSNAGRCGEARDAYAAYAELVRTLDPRKASVAEAYATECVATPPPPVGGEPEAAPSQGERPTESPAPADEGSSEP